MMSKAACFPLSQLRTSTSAGRVWLRSGVKPMPDSNPLQGGHVGRTQNKHVTQIVVSEVSCFTGRGGGVIN